MTSDTPRLRRDILIRAQQLALDIDRVEDELERYRGYDEPQFRAWFDLHFENERLGLAELETRLAVVSQRHNAVVALANMHDLSLEHAQRMITQEEAALVNANEATRLRITQERVAREAFIRADLEREVLERLGRMSTTGIEVPDALPTTDQPKSLKTTYRRLVKRLHPDVARTDECPTELRWQRRIWSLLQAAYARGDVQTLDSLYRVTLLRQMDFGELTADDARDAYGWLEREFAALTAERDAARARPAWGFTTVTAYEDLADRVREEFRLDAESIRNEIQDIEAQFDYLRLLDGKPTARSGSTRDLILDHRPRSTRRPRKADARAINQLSFFD